MNFRPLLLILPAFTGHLFAQTAKPVMRDAATHQELSQRLKIARQNEPLRDFEKFEGEDPAKVNRPPDIIATSDVICFNGNATLVPKNSIIWKPTGFESRFTYSPGAQVMTWGEFLAANRGWISTIEVTRAQAEGREPLSETVKASLAQNPNLVIATYMHGPISILPAKTPPATAPAKP